jgi:hypothetical protein
MRKNAVRRLRAGLTVIIAAGAALAVAAPGTASASGTNTHEHAAVAAVAIGGTWEGTYTCAQGLTGLDLKISRPGSGSALDATFSFYPIPKNPAWPSGIYTMRGTYHSAASITLHFRHWIRKPAGYIWANLSGRLTGDRFHGRVISGPGGACTTFSAKKLRGSYTRKRVIGKWKGKYTGCSQGTTGLTLTIKPKKGGNRISAIFKFYPLPSNPAPAKGSYLMSGYYFPGGIALVPVRWIVNPGGYVMVNVVGAAPRHGRMTGAVVTCTAFSVKRT